MIHPESQLIKKAQNDLAFSREMVSNAMIRQPGFYFWYANLRVKATRQCKMMKMVVESLEADIYKDLCEENNRVTERMVATASQKNKEWLKISRNLMKAEHIRDLLSEICKSFEHRRDMLINLSATLRSEMDSELRTKNKENYNVSR